MPTISEKRKLWGSPCVICGTTGDTEIDHVIPRSRGGSNRIENLQPLCRVCNAIKGHSRSNADVINWIITFPDKFKLKQMARVIRREAILRNEVY